MRTVFYNLGREDSYYGRPILSWNWTHSPALRQAYLDGYCDYLECCA